MHVLTLIGCVLFSDVGPRDEGRGGGRREGWGGGGERRSEPCLCVRAGVCLRNCVCGLDQPPEFTLQLRED